MAAELEELIKTFKELSLVAEKQDRNKQLYEKKAKLLTIAYLIFQATAFVSITKQARSSGGRHQNFLWIPLVLSMLSSLIYLLALLGIFFPDFFWVGHRPELSFVEQGTVDRQIREDESHYIQIRSSFCN